MSIYIYGGTYKSMDNGFDINNKRYFPDNFYYADRQSTAIRIHLSYNASFFEKTSPSSSYSALLAEGIDYVVETDDIMFGETYTGDTFYNYNVRSIQFEPVDSVKTYRGSYITYPDAVGPWYFEGTETIGGNLVDATVVPAYDIPVFLVGDWKFGF